MLILPVGMSLIFALSPANILSNLITKGEITSMPRGTILMGILVETYLVSIIKDRLIDECLNGKFFEKTQRSGLRINFFKLFCINLITLANSIYVQS